MPDPSDPLDPGLAPVVDYLRRPVPADPALTDQVMRRVLDSGRGHRKPWWVIPLLAAALVLVAIGLNRQRRATEAIEFRLRAPGAASVSLVGDFNDWDAGATPLNRVGGDQWSVRLPLEPGRYQFTYIVDGNRWVPDPVRPRVQDDYGEPTSVVTVLDTSSL